MRGAGIVGGADESVGTSAVADAVGIPNNQCQVYLIEEVSLV